jgi:hypothetical protein
MRPEDMDDTVITPRRLRTSGTRVHGEDIDEDTDVAPLPKLVEPPRRSAHRSTTDRANRVGRIRQAGEATEPAPLAGYALKQFFRFRVGNCEPVVLDHPAYIGRQPRSPRITNGERPLLVRVPSPQREVSSTHVEIRQDGTSVVVTDLKSTNGTVVTMPKRAPHRLRQGESIAVTAGTLVDIGDGILIEILPTSKVVS